MTMMKNKLAIFWICLVVTSSLPVDCMSASLGADFCTPQVIETNIANKANPNDVSNENGTNLLMCTALRGDVASTKFLLDSGADASLQDHFGNTALHYAAIVWKDSPFTSAEINDRKQIISMLVAHGADPNRVNKDHLSPMAFLSASRQSCEAIEAVANQLLDEGTAPDSISDLIWFDNHDKTTIFGNQTRYGCMYQIRNILERYLIEEGKRTGDSESARRKLISVLETDRKAYKIIKSGMSLGINSIEQSVETDKRVISGPPKPILMEFAVKNGYNVNLHKSFLLRFFAENYAQNENDQWVAFLLNHGANPDIAGKDGRTARQILAEKAGGGFQWGKFAALAAGTMIGSQGMASADKATLLMGNAFDSREGVEGMQSTQMAGGMVMNNIQQRHDEQAKLDKIQSDLAKAKEVEANNNQQLLKNAAASHNPPTGQPIPPNNSQPGGTQPAGPTSSGNTSPPGSQGNTGAAPKTIGTTVVGNPGGTATAYPAGWPNQSTQPNPISGGGGGGKPSEYSYDKCILTGLSICSSVTSDTRGGDLVVSLRNNCGFRIYASACIRTKSGGKDCGADSVRSGGSVRLVWHSADDAAGIFDIRRVGIGHGGDDWSCMGERDKALGNSEN